jgi:hypothetical protein
MTQSAAAMTLTVVLGLAPAGRANTDDGQSRRAVAAVLGIGTPVGAAGLEGSYWFGPKLELSAGLGLGLSASAAQWAVMPRYRIGSARQALTLGLGVSGGDYAYTLASLCGSQEEFVECHTSDTRYTVWVNAELGGEHVGPSGFTLRYFVGVGRIVAQGADHCTYLNQPSDNCGGIPGNTLPYATIPYFGVALGHTF